MLKKSGIGPIPELMEKSFLKIKHFLNFLLTNPSESFILFSVKRYLTDQFD